jgi:hypothetical protein
MSNVIQFEGPVDRMYRYRRAANAAYHEKRFSDAREYIRRAEMAERRVMEIMRLAEKEEQLQEALK